MKPLNLQVSNHPKLEKSSNCSQPVSTSGLRWCLGGSLKQDVMTENLLVSTGFLAITFCLFSCRFFLMFPHCSVGPGKRKLLRMATTARILGCNSSYRIFNQLQDAANIFYRSRNVGSSMSGSRAWILTAKCIVKPFDNFDQVNFD